MKENTYRQFKLMLDRMHYKNIGLERINRIEAKLEKPSLKKIVDYLEMNDEVKVFGVMTHTMMIAEVLCNTRTDIVKFDIPAMQRAGWIFTKLDKSPEDFHLCPEGFTEKYVSLTLWTCKCKTNKFHSQQLPWCSKCETHKTDALKVKSIKDLMELCHAMQRKEKGN